MPRKLYNTAVITNIYNVQLVNFLTPSSHTYWNLWRLLLSLLFFFFVFTNFFFHFALAPAVVVFLSYSWGERIKNSRVWASCSFSSTLSLSFSLSLNLFVSLSLVRFTLLPFIHTPRAIVCVRAFATTIQKSVYTFSFRKIFILLLFYFPNCFGICSRYEKCTNDTWVCDSGRFEFVHKRICAVPLLLFLLSCSSLVGLLVFFSFFCLCCCCCYWCCCCFFISFIAGRETESRTRAVC